MKLVKIASSHHEFTIKNLDKLLPIESTTRMETITLDWEIAVPSYDETLVTLYFFGKFNDLNVLHPVKVLLTVV